eukprot:s347_g14.t2
MVLKETSLCEHSSYHGGDERQFHRGANGYSRFVMCKVDTCDKPVIKAKRKTPHELWAYLVQIALCTKWGQAARSRALFNTVCKVRGEADEERRVEAAWYCAQVLDYALDSRNALHPEIYRFAFYLFGRVKLVHSAAMRSIKSGAARPDKRTANPDDMVANRHIRVPLQHDANHPDIMQLHDCEVMMTMSPDDDNDMIAQAYVASDADLPGLAILDSGCTRTMHGQQWAERFEEALASFGLSPKSRVKNQLFAGVGGQVASTTVKVFPIGINKIHGEIHSAETPGAAPLLLSRPFMEELDTVLDLGKGTVSFRKINVLDLPLVKTSRGHLAVNFLDFDLDKLDDFTSEETHQEIHDGYLQEVPQDDVPDGYVHDPMLDLPEGMNPDDWLDYQFELSHWRQEAANADQVLAEIAADRDRDAASTTHGPTCEDTFLFESIVQEQPSTIRKATHKKTKKLLAMSNAVDGDDWRFFRVLSGQTTVPKTPPYGKCWMKQIFAGQMGANTFGQRTVQASVWPDKLNKLVLETIVQQAVIEQAAFEQAHESFPAEVRRLPQNGKSPKRRRKGRVSTLTSQYGGAPPVYLRPSEPLLPAIQDEGDLDNPPLEDDADLRARQASQLQPVLHRAESQRREEWLKIDPEIRKVLRTLHVNFGHPTSITLQRILRRQGAKYEAIVGAGLLSCDACGESIRRRRPKPVRLPNKYVFNNHLIVDVFYGKDIENESFCFLNVVDDATGFQVVSCLGTVRGPPASQAILRHFLTSWSSWAGLPTSIQADLGKEFMADFIAYMKQFSVETENMPLEAPWKSGKVEKAGGIWKDILLRTMPKGSQRNYKWFGPARVIGCELRSPARLQDDEEVPTEGGQPRSYWLRYFSSVVLVTGEQLRFASEDELIAAHSIPQEVLEPEYARGARNFVDFRGPLAAPSQPEEPLGLPAPSSGPLGNAPYLPDGFANPPAPLPPGVAPEPDSPGYSPSEQAPDQDGDQPLQPEAPTNDEVPAEQTDQPMGLLDQQPPAHDRQVSTISGAPEPEPQPANTPAGQERLGLGFMPPGPASDSQPGNLHTALQNPDRLDGYRPIPRQHGQRPFQPYFVEEDDFDCETLPTTLQGKRLERMLNYEGDALTSSQSEDEKEQCFVEGQGPGDVFLTGKAVRFEISLKDLSPEDRAKYDVSMGEEWSSWQKFNAVEVLTPQQIENLPEDTKIIGTRWVHTDKNQKKRLMSAALQGRTGKTQAQIQKEFPLEAKSRLVVQGHQETDTGIRSDSPTASLLAFNLVCAVAVIQRWIVMACDASTPRLQSNGISRLLLLRPPRPPPPGISPHDLLRALGSIYGTKDAGRAWWKKLFKTLRYYNWIMSRIEHALFFLVVDGKLCGILITHVDDLFCAGEGQQFHDSIEALEKDIHLKINKGKFRFCGKNVFQREDFSIEIDQYDAIEAIDYMALSAP